MNRPAPARLPSAFTILPKLFALRDRFVGLFRAPVEQVGGRARLALEAIEERLVPAVTVVAPGLMGDWATLTINTATAGFGTGPGVAPLGDGSFRMTSGSGTGPSGGGKTYLGTDAYNGALGGLTSISYDTYVTAAGLAGLGPYLNVYLDLNGDGAADDALVYDPARNGGAATGAWQTWSITQTSGLWYGAGGVAAGAIGNPSGYRTLAQVLAAFPSATVVGPAPGAPQGFIVLGGQLSGGSWANFDASVDRIVINSDTYDLEPVAPTVSVAATVPAAFEGGTSGQFTVTRTGPTDRALDVTVAVGGSAVQTTDYTPILTTVTIGVGQSSATVAVNPVDDAWAEADETVVLRVVDGPGTGYLAGAAPLATVTIFDDEFRGGVIDPSGFTPIECGCDCPPLIGSAPGSTPPNPGTTSSQPVRYADGTVRLASTDLASDGAAAPWGQTRSWTNGSGYGRGQGNGSGWVISQAPRLLQVDGTDTLALVTDGLTARYFDRSGGAYVERFGGHERLVHDAGTDTYTLTTGTGDVFTFGGFSSALPQFRRGQFESRTTAAGVRTEAVGWTGEGRIAEVRGTADGVTESHLYTYVGTGVNAGLLASVAHRRSTDGGATWDAVESVEYAYYDGVEAHGNAGDLKTATVKDEAGAVETTDYYRYYTAGEAGGYEHGLKYALLGASYDQARAALGGTAGAVEAATDSAVAPYADHYFEFDATGRVTEEVASGAGCSTCSGGQGTFTFAYTTSGNADGHNSWKTKTVETLPNGTVNTVYTNAYGAVMLEAVTDTATSQTWVTYYRYDADGRVVLIANPSAVTGYDDTSADLVNDVNGNATYLSDSTGLVTAYVYASATTATTSVAGDAVGFLKSTEIQQGETGTAVPQQTLTYIKNTVSGEDYFHVASETAYRNDNGTGAQTTGYAYTFHSGTNQIASTTVTLPTVTTAQNGSNSATAVVVVNDAFGRPVWTKDQDGFITYTEYDPLTGMVAKVIVDVDTTRTGTFANLPSGWTTPSGGGLHLTTSYEVDELGRATKATHPNGRVDYTVYDDANHEVRHYAGWDAVNGRPTGPTVVTRMDRAGRYTETLTMSAAPAVASGRPTGAEAIAQVQSLSRSYTNEAGQVTHTDAYFDLGGLTYSTSTTLGVEGVNFYRTRYQYDDTGGVKRVQTPQGTITRFVRDGLGRVVSEWVGTDDTPTTGFWSPTNTAGANLVMVRSYEYDGGGVGDGNRTETVEYPGGAPDRITTAWYDWRNRAVAIKSGVEGSESSDVNRPLAYYDYDNLGNVTKTRVYDADGVTPTVTGGVPQPLSSSLLRAQSTTSFDELGRAYRSDVYSVDPSTGAVGADTLHSLVWYDARGNVVKAVSPGGLVQKTSYDGVGRVTAEYTSDGGGDTGYSDADDVTGDTVLEQVEYAYDDSGNVLTVTSRQRFHDASGTGALGSPSSGIGARVSYAGFYYDLADRLTATVDVGTNAGAWTRPGSVPTGTSTVLVTETRYATDAVQTVTLTGTPTGGTFTLSFGGQTTGAIAYNASASAVQTALEALSSIGAGNVAVAAAPGGTGWEVRFTGALADQYQSALTASGSGLTGGTLPGVSVAVVNAGGDAGRAAETTDTAGREHRTYADALGRTVRTVQRFVDGVVSDGDDKTTGYTYNGAGMTSLSAYLTGGGAQTTEYVYGVSQGTGSEVDSNDVVGITRWPDPSTGAASGAEQEAVTVNALGQVLTATDRNGTTHELTYDVLGRLTVDEVTAFGAGVDTAVERIEVAYDGQGNAYQVTSYGASNAVANEVVREFNGLGQLITEYQEHGGLVNTSTSPKVQYGYSNMPSGENHSRLTSITYPDGYVLTYNYSSGLDGDISRLSSLSDSSGTLEAFAYLGLGTVVVRSRPQIDVDMTHVGAPGDAGDQYAGLDRFGRTARVLWEDTTGPTAIDQYDYTYDAASNRLTRDNGVNGAFDEAYNYDGLDQLASFTRGGYTRSWDYDAAGNWDGVTTNGTTQARIANAQNEITGIGGATTPTYDANGNMTGDETGRTFVYDAWNRLVAVEDSGATLKTYEYDGLNRRISETESGTTTDLFYSADWQVLTEKVGSATTNRYVWSPVYVDALVLRDRDTNADGTLDERLWVVQDANWNVTALVDGSGVAVERYAYDPYGVRTVYDAGYTVRVSSSYAWTQGFQGMFLDSTSGLNVSRGRPGYSPTLGRWVTMDPIGYAAGDVNLYGFVANSPINFADPSGLEKYELERDRKPNCACECIKNPADCKIEITFLKKGDSVKWYYTDPATKREQSVSISVATDNKAIKDDLFEFRVEVPVIIKIVSKTGKDVSGCNLRQDVTVGSWNKTVGGKVTEGQKIEKDYWSGHYDLAKGKDKNKDHNLAYGGSWFFDSPDNIGAVGKKENAKAQGFTQFHVYIEEAPKVEMYWGYYYAIDWDKLAFTTLKTFGPQDKPMSNPFTEKK